MKFLRIKKNVVVLFFLFIVVLFSFFIILILSQNMDINILGNINVNRNRQFDQVFVYITNSADPVAFGIPAILFFSGLLNNESVLKKKAVYIGTAVISAAIFSNILKYIINRPRPFVTYPYIEKLTSGGNPSLPSGHTSSAFVLATSISLAYPKWYVIIPAYTWAGAVGYSRMYLGVHYPSDVLLGAIIGAVSAYLCYKGQQLLNEKKQNEKQNDWDNSNYR